MPNLDADAVLNNTDHSDNGVAEKNIQNVHFTKEQVSNGRDAYMDNCGTCHGSQLNNGEFGGPPLKGSYFKSHWGGVPMITLYGFISSAMPPDKPGRLNKKVYADIVAFILSKNGYDATGEPFQIK